MKNDTLFAEPIERYTVNGLFVRIAIGKSLGFVFGLIGFFSLPYFLPDTDLMLRWGVLLWYPTVGATIGAFGLFDYHPVLRLPLPWWFRGPVVGAWMNFVLTLFAFETMAELMTAVFGENGFLQSPFWFTVEGAIIGFIISYFATRFGGEGKRALVD